MLIMLMTTAAALAAQIDQSSQLAASAPVASSAGSPGAAPVTTKKPTRYCIKVRPTGSILLKTTCKTRDAWLNEGFDPLEKQ
jgi:hypothetical protein